MKILAVMAGSVLAGGVFALTSCQEFPPAYPLPEQRPAFDVFKTHSARMVNMGDTDAESRFVRDISSELDGSWRWSLARPAVRIRVRADQNLKYKIDFTLPDVTFKDTGPVTITFTVNDHVLDRILYTRAGEEHFEKPVPPQWMEAGKDAIVGAEIDKLWTSQRDGKQFGFIITRIGLTQ
jgi:hypothetical protein